MALSVDYIYKYALNLIRKNQSGGLGSIDFAYKWNAEQCAYQDDLLGRFQLRNNGKEGANTGLIQNETILQKLDPFIKSSTITVTSGSGTKPSDLVYRLSMRIGAFNCYKINNNQIANVNASVIDPPSVANNRYYFYEIDSVYLFLPSTVTSATIGYVSTPTDVLWAYTFDINGRQVYDSANSVQPIWDNSSAREITKRMLKSMGVSFKDADFQNFGASQIQTGD